MYEIDVTTKSGKKVDHLTITEPLIYAGKDANSCKIRLIGWRIAPHHASFRFEDNRLFVSPESNKHPVYVNNELITEEYGPLANSDQIQIHNYVLTPKTGRRQNVPDAPESIELAPASNFKSSDPVDIAPPRHQTQTNTVAPMAKAKPRPTSESQHQDLYREWQLIINNELLQEMDLRRLDVNQMSDEELRELTQRILQDILQNHAQNGSLPAQLDQQELLTRALAEAVGLGPLESLLEADNISEIMVNNANEIYYEEDGKLFKSDVTFSSDRAVLYAIERIVTPIGRRIDEGSPLVDARLKDGSRVNAVIPPLALKGPCITIRKFMKEHLIDKHLVDFGSASPEMMSFLKTAVENRQNVVISGGTGSGKTTLLNILSNYIPQDERIVTVEDAAELRLYQPNLVSLEARPPNQEGKGMVSIRDLVKNCLRMRPDRIVVGECRSGEALDMMQAMNTGHNGSLTTLHANTPSDCLSRLEVLVLMAEMDLPSRAIREQIASAVQLIVQQSRLACGSRKITSVSEVTGIEGETIQIAEIFRFHQQGFDDNGKTVGEFRATGLTPKFYEDLSDKGLTPDFSIFQNRKEAV